MSYAKLFSSITESSLWSEPKEVRLLFVSMLARSDAAGYIEASVPGLARLANLTIPEVEHSITVLESPDLHSKDLDAHPENEGRRILRAPGGWMIINFEEYRARRGEEERREYMRGYMREYRSRVGKLAVNFCKPPLAAVSHGKAPLAQAEAEAEEGMIQVQGTINGGAKGSPPTAEMIISELSVDPTYEGIDVKRELGKMAAWCKANGKQPTKRRFVNWLNRADKPLPLMRQNRGPNL